MEGLLKFASCMMLVFLITTQLILASPYRVKLTNDEINGRTLKTNETLIYRGTITVDALGQYTPNSAVLLVNGQAQKIVDAFPVELPVCDSDVVEVQMQLGSLPFYIFVASQKGDITTDMTESTILIHPGVNRLLRVSPLLNNKG